MSRFLTEAPNCHQGPQGPQGPPNPFILAPFVRSPWLLAFIMVLVSAQGNLAETIAPSWGPSKNSLADAASPYLREAGHQPVHWQPWGKAAFRLAQEADKPILLDIGAIWCHWCHVMDVESYENQEIAEVINRHFIAIKVDMDERPDIDRRYQEAVQALSGQGGWPLTAFLTPGGQVFFGGTYFPPTAREGRVGLKELLPALVEAYAEGKADVLASAAQLSNTLVRYGRRSLQQGEVSEALIETVVTSMTKEFDREHGGFGTGTKFPSGSAMELALARHFHQPDPIFIQLVTKTLDAMATGGMYDHLGGGFFRYTTDPGWTIPHFEKMNYDNAELLMNYLHAYQATEIDLYRERAEGILGYLTEVLSDQRSGGFYAHQDADMTREDDGDYYTWTVQEVREALPPEEAEIILRYYGIEAAGEMRDNPAKNVLSLAMTPETLGQELQVSRDVVMTVVQRGITRMKKVRDARKTPFVDRTLFVDRNGMLITAYLEAFQVLGRVPLRSFALLTLDRLLEVAYRRGQGMYHAMFEGKARVSGLLNDQVHMANAALKAFEVTGNPHYIEVAQDLMSYTINTFWDKEAGGFLDRAPEDHALAALERTVKDLDDSPSTSPNAVAAIVLARLAALTNHEEFDRKARSTLETFAGVAPRLGRFAAGYALAVHYALHPPAQAVIIGELDDQKTRKLWQAAAESYRPGKLLAVYDPQHVQLERLPAPVVAAVKIFGTQGEAKAYVCAGRTCAPPSSDPQEVAVLVHSYGVTVVEGP